MTQPLSKSPPPTIPEDYSLSVTYVEQLMPVFWEYRNSAQGILIASAIRDDPNGWATLYEAPDDNPIPASVQSIIEIIQG